MLEFGSLIASIITVVMQRKDRPRASDDAALREALKSLYFFGKDWAQLAQDLKVAAQSWEAAGFPQENDHGFLRALGVKQAYVRNEFLSSRLCEPQIMEIIDLYAPDLQTHDRLVSLRARAAGNLEDMGPFVLQHQEDAAALTSYLHAFYGRTDEVIAAVEDFRVFLAGAFPLS